MVTWRVSYAEQTISDISDYDIDPTVFGTVIRDSPKYKIIDETSSEAKPDGPVPTGAKLTANSEMLFGPERFIMDNARGLSETYYRYGSNFSDVNFIPNSCSIRFL